MNARAGKAALLGESPSFAAAAASRGPSERGRLIDAAMPLAAESNLTPRVARLEDLALNPFNPRVTLTEIAAMAESLLQDGQLQAAAVVTRDAFLAAYPGSEDELGDASYVVIDGNRRLAGARQAGLEELRIDVNDDLASSDSEALTKALVANIHNEALSPMEEARALATLLPVYGGQRALARRLSKSHPWVGQRLALLNLTDELQAAVESGDLPVEDARRIGRLPQDEQADAAGQAAEARQEQKSRRAAVRQTAGRRAADEGPADPGRDADGDRPAPPPDSTPPLPDAADGARPSGAADRGPATSDPVESVDGKGVTTLLPGPGPAGGETDDGTDGSVPTSSAPPPAAARPGPSDPAGPAAAGNDAAAPPARTRVPRSPGPGDIDWADLPSLAMLIRDRLTAGQLRDLVGFLTDDS